MGPEENTSVSNLAGKMFEEQRRGTDEYWRPYERGKKLAPIKGIDALKQIRRDELSERR
jgi:hypothetical protein